MLYPSHLDLSADLECEAEGCDLVPGRDPREGTRAGSNLSPRRRDGLGCGVSDSKPRQICEDGERERLSELVLPAPTDPYIDFAFSLDVTHYENPKRTNEPSAAVGLDYPSVSETLRHLGSTIGLPTGADATVDLIPMDIDKTLSASTPQLFSSGEGEAQRRGLLSNCPLSHLPFQPSTSGFPSLAPSSSLSPVMTAARNPALPDLDLSSSLVAPIQVRPQTSLTPATVSGSGLALGYAKSASVLVDSDSAAEVPEKVFAGPSLFLDDDGME